MSQLQTHVLAGLEPAQAQRFEQQLDGRNLEQALSRVRRIEALLADGPGVIDGLDSTTAALLDRGVCHSIVSSLSTDGADLAPARSFAAWAKRTDYHRPLEVFTVNYDLLIETAFDEMRVTYFDGFVGSVRAQFHTDLVEEWSNDSGPRMPTEFVRLWKLHGSVNWAWAADGTHDIVRLGQPVLNGDVAAIYPSDAKYEESRRVPFIVLQDRFRRALQLPETLMLISGYSFSDDHLNKLVFDATSRRERSEVNAFFYGEIPDSVAACALQTPNLQVLGPAEAVIGGVRAPWRTPPDPPEGIWDAGGFALGDFKALASYLARSTAQKDESVNAAGGGHALLGGA